MRKQLYKDFGAAIERGTAGLFVGAGLSQSAGYPGWGALLKDIAAELSLDVTQEHDLVAVAQYHLNKNNKIRTRLAKIVLESFPDDVAIPEVYRVMARLPIDRIWTTNYDRLIERAFREQHKSLDVKSRDKDLSSQALDASAVLLKMHGTVDHPGDVVIAKDDYELYARERSTFLRALAGDFSNRTLLFLGFSFTDPNLYNLMAMIRATLDDTPAIHYTITRRPKLEDFKTKKDPAAEFAYAKNRFELWSDDLIRYGMQAVVIDEYDEIRQILVELERHHAQRSVFVSGSYPVDGGVAAENVTVAQVAYSLGGLIAKRKLRLVSGFGLTVGDKAIMGTMEELYRKPVANLERRLLLRPFPAGLDTAQKTRYREDMMSHAGVCVVVAGTVDGKVPAEGVLEEARIAAALGRAVVPVAATGHAAAQLWEEMSNANQIPKGVSSEQWGTLKTATSVDEIIDVVGKVLSSLGVPG